MVERMTKKEIFKRRWEDINRLVEVVSNGETRERGRKETRDGMVEAISQFQHSKRGRQFVYRLIKTRFIIIIFRTNPESCEGMRKIKRIQGLIKSITKEESGK